MHERRTSPRIPFATDVWIRHEWIGQSRYETADMSDGGLFLEMTEHPFKGGEIISIQVCDYDEAPLLHAQVVRITEKGIGIAYLLDDAAMPVAEDSD